MDEVEVVEDEHDRHGQRSQPAHEPPEHFGLTAQPGHQLREWVTERHVDDLPDCGDHV